MNDMDERRSRRFSGRLFGPFLALLVLFGVVVPRHSCAASESASEVRLTGVPVLGTHYYRMTTAFVTIEPDGLRHRPDVYDVWIEYIVLPDGGAQLTCRRFDARPGDSVTVSIPALRDWSYRARITDSGLDERGWIFGIDQAKFAGLTDERGAVLPPGTVYCVFNAFVDFHSFGEVFVRRADGGGIQDLQRVGQRIVHAASYKEAPISLGDFAEKGSIFKLGEVTLTLKGTSVLDGQRCALIGYDSGDCSLTMNLKPAPQVLLEAHGSSHFFGDLYVDLATQSVREATLAEFVVQEISGAALPQKIHTVVERKLVLRDLPQDEFEHGLGTGTVGLGGKP